MTAECHEITTANGRAEFAYVGQKAWHGLGQMVPAGAGVEDMADAAGMRWRIERTPLLYAFPTTDAGGAPVVDTRTFPNRVVLHRGDNGAPLGVVSARYHEVQPIEVLEFFREMAEVGGFTLETAGTMRGGARQFATVKVPHDLDLPGGDHVASYLLFATGCDGSLATSILPTTVRVVCRNTLRAALSAGKKGMVYVPHSKKFDAKEAQEKLRAISKEFDTFAKAAEQLTRIQCTSAQAQELLKRVLPASPNVLPEDSRAFKKIMALFEGAGKGMDLASARGTRWGLLNAVTEFTDHHVPARTPDSRLESATFGAGDALKERALGLLTA